MAEPVVELRIIVPKRIAEKIDEVAAKNGLTREDVILRAIVKVLEELE
jgi:hypothetical protein